MKSNTLAVVIAVLSSASMLAQESPRATAPAPNAPPATMQSNVLRAGRMRSGVPTADSASQLSNAQIKDLEETIGKMQTLLKAMRTKATASRGKAELDNVHLWELLVAHLDHTLAREKRVAAERADFLARREAMYRQSQLNAESAAARARAAAAMASSPAQNAESPATQIQPQQAPSAPSTEAAPKN